MNQNLFETLKGYWRERRESRIKEQETKIKELESKVNAYIKQLVQKNGESYNIKNDFSTDERVYIIKRRYIRAAINRYRSELQGVCTKDEIEELQNRLLKDAENEYTSYKNERKSLEYLVEKTKQEKTGGEKAKVTEGINKKVELVK